MAGTGGQVGIWQASRKAAKAKAKYVTQHLDNPLLARQRQENMDLLFNKSVASKLRKTRISRSRTHTYRSSSEYPRGHNKERRRTSEPTIRGNIGEGDLIKT